MLSDIDKADLSSIAQEGRGKTPEFTRAMFDQMGVPVDTHMNKLLNMRDGVDPKSWLNKARYVAYKALVGHTAKAMSWKPSEVQEAAWSSALGIQLMKKHGFDASNVADFLTHGTVSQQWDMHHVFSLPEVRRVLVERLGVPESTVSSLARPSAGDGGAAGHGLPARGQVAAPDPEALRGVAERIPAAAGKATLGTRLILPEGKQYPEGARPQTERELRKGKKRVSIGHVRPPTAEELKAAQAKNRAMAKKKPKR